MTNEEKWEFINRLDEELLQGGVMLSEWSIFLARDAETAFCYGANLAAILSAQAAIESHLRYEYFTPQESKGWGLHRLMQELSNRTNLDLELIGDLDELRRFRNKWVHVEDPSSDSTLLERPELHEQELEEMAQLAIKSMLRVLYLEQWI